MNIKIFEPDEIHSSALALLQNHTISAISDSTVEAVVIRTYTQINQEFLERYPSLKYIVRAGVGLDTIDMNACKKRGIQVFNSPGANANAVSELVILDILLLKRKVFSQIKSLKNNTWRDRTNIGSEIKGSIIGIVGCGAIGQLVARKLEGFEVEQILGYDPFLTAEQLQKFGIVKTTLEEVYRKADIITIHVPLVPETKNLITLREFKKMKKTCIVINTSRGGIVNESDLMVALTQKYIAGAALDVFENEPTIQPELLTIDNLIVTPHIGALTQEAEEAMSVEAVSRFLQALQ